MATNATPTITRFGRFNDVPAVPLVPGMPSLKAKVGWEAEVTHGDRTYRLTMLDGDDRWVVDGEWRIGSSWPIFWNGRGSRCTIAVLPSTEVASALNAELAYRLPGAAVHG